MFIITAILEGREGFRASFILFLPHPGHCRPTANIDVLRGLTSCPLSRGIVPRIHKLRSPIAEISELWKVASFKLGGGQNIAFHASPAARNYGFVISVLVAHSASFLSFLFRQCRVWWTVNLTLICDLRTWFWRFLEIWWRFWHLLAIWWYVWRLLVIWWILVSDVYLKFDDVFLFWCLLATWWLDYLCLWTFTRDLMICASDVLLVIWLLMSTKVCPSHLTVC